MNQGKARAPKNFIGAAESGRLHRMDAADTAKQNKGKKHGNAPAGYTKV